MKINMKMEKPAYSSVLFFVIFAIYIFSCQNPVPEAAAQVSDEQTAPAEAKDPYTIKGENNYLTGYKAFHEDGDINVVVEIPTGSVQKWEVDKTSGNLKWEFVDGKPREVKY